MLNKNVTTNIPFIKTVCFGASTWKEHTMQIQKVPVPENILLAQILNYNHRGVIHKLVHGHGMTTEEAQKIFEDTKRFLYLVGINPGNSYGPPAKIDVGWHEFILHTKDYASFCEKHFGRFIHHVPNRPGDARDTMRPQRTLRAAISTFGTSDLSSNWEFQNPLGETVLGPNNLEYIEASDTCGDSCGCSPCKG